MDLIPGESVLKARLEEQLEENQRRHEEIKAGHLDRIEVKKARQQDKGLPSEKSPV